ncbi:hypothetical protein BB14905_05503 [Bacillus sp. B14905]|nr:hypothetical protein BB14905_05503 [Bacillus sp. B14905]
MTMLATTIVNYVVDSFKSLLEK